MKACAIRITVSLIEPVFLRQLAIAQTQHRTGLVAFHFMRSKAEMVLHNIKAPWFWHENKLGAMILCLLDMVNIEINRD